MSGLSRYGTAGDVHGFYGALGIRLAPRADHEAAVACFADPDAHRRGDRDPSCSVNVTSGAWLCHGCGAHGGAYDAALLHGRTPRQAIDLMVFHGLTERRPTTGPSRRRRGRDRHPGPTARPASPTDPRAGARLDVTDAQLAAWRQRLLAHDRLLAELERRRAWSPEILARHGVGWDGTRIVFAVHDLAGELVGVLRYAPPWRRTGPKVIAVPGSRRGLFPSPAAIHSPTIWIVEGQPDALAANSAGLPALGIPGVWGWERRWAASLTGRDVVVCTDADPEGRAAAQRIATSLAPAAAGVRVLDLDPRRDDGYDLSDAIRECGLPRAGAELQDLARRARPHVVDTA